MMVREAPLRKRFVLSGPSASLDLKIHAVRGDLADIALADRVFAPHYAKAIRRKIAVSTTVFSKPGNAADAVDDLAIGDDIDLFDVSGGWGWVRTTRAIGYVPIDCIASA